ncbi:hypothetical protein GGF42_003595 [Coemansia sp. RSA 2424]|nr:hypothetical protein GGF42_003595 [Coemansia sp. RSA 2424]
MAGGLYTPTAKDNAPRPIAAVRARKYAMEQGSDMQDERRSLRRFRSDDVSRAEALAAATAPTAASERRAAVPAIGPGMRQQSETGSMRRPVNRVAGRTAPSVAGPSRPPVRVPTRADSANAHKPIRRDPSPAPSAGSSQIPRVPQSPQAGGLCHREGSKIPRLAASGQWVSNSRMYAQELGAAHDCNDQLMAELNNTTTLMAQLSAELTCEREKTAEAAELACRLEAELRRERSFRAELETKITILEGLLADRNSATDPATERFEGREALQDTMSPVLASCASKRSRPGVGSAARRDFSLVEAYIASDAAQQPPLSARDDDARVKRRRSSMLFADLMLPSGGGPAIASTGACERCGQLAESMQCLEADNDYYRDANRKLRDAVNDTTSRHNALVRIFEVERARRREVHAAGLAEASRQATHERIMLDAADPLASRFERSLHIAQSST